MKGRGDCSVTPARDNCSARVQEGLRARAARAGGGAGVRTDALLLQLLHSGRRGGREREQAVLRLEVARALQPSEELRGAGRVNASSSAGEGGGRWRRGGAVSERCENTTSVQPLPPTCATPPPRGLALHYVGPNRCRGYRSGGPSRARGKHHRATSGVWSCGCAGRTEDSRPAPAQATSAHSHLSSRVTNTVHGMITDVKGLASAGSPTVSGRLRGVPRAARATSLKP